MQVAAAVPAELEGPPPTSGGGGDVGIAFERLSFRNGMGFFADELVRRHLFSPGLKPFSRGVVNQLIINLKFK